MHEVLAVCGAIAWATGKLNDLEQFFKLALIVGGMAACILTLIFHRTLVALLAMAFVVMIGVWFVNGGGIQWGAKQIGGETGSGAVAAVTAPASDGAC